MMKNNMNSKKWIKILAVLCVLGVGFVGGINYLVDPFNQYRVKTFYPIAFIDERYQNAGLSKNFEYDSLILGTSMTENFLINKVEEDLNFKKAIKLSISGGSAKEQSITLQTAIQNNKKLKNVLWGLDTFVFIGEADRLRFGNDSFPFYLYDKNIINDYKYILSIDTLVKSAKAIIRPYLKNDKIIYDYNRMYEWQYNNENKFTLMNIKNSWQERKKFLDIETDKQTFDYMKKSFDSNFLSIIRENKQINFKIFLPPYSILAFKNFEEKKTFNEILTFKKYIFKTLINFENVRIYDFQIEKNITHDLNNYKDLSHYHQKINNWITQQISQDNYLVKKETIDKNIEILNKQVREYKIEF